MTYEKWQEEHQIKHKAILKKLEGKSLDEVINYFTYNSMQKNEPDYCPLYKENKKCHTMENLNCYFCACPEFRLEKGLHVKSSCAINSKYGSTCKVKNEVHQDCSDCIIPHKIEYIKRLARS